jgi:hypothetical protein
MLEQHPNLLMFSTATLQVGHVYLCSSGTDLMNISVLHCCDAHYAKHNIITTACCILLLFFQAKIQRLGAIFGLAPLRAAELVTSTPRLLTLSSARLTASRDQLVGGLGMHRDALPALVSQCPALILEAPATVSAAELQADVRALLGVPCCGLDCCT